MIKVGIDPGVNTGIAVMNGQLKTCLTEMIHEALGRVKIIADLKYELIVIVEDARKRSGSPAAAQGAGSIKRDCKIWEDFLKDHKIPFKMVPPIRNGTRYRDVIFKSNYPYWKARTSEHARAAANLLVVH